MDFLNLILTIIFAGIIVGYAYFKKKIDTSAVIATIFVGLFIIFTLGFAWVYVILGFFIFGNLVSRYKIEVKEKEGVAEGVRTFRNVFGNGSSATIFALFYLLTNGNPVFLFAFVGAIATATADTFATEIGEAHEKRPRLITMIIKRVKIGTPGAVSLPGFIGSIVGAGIVSLIPVLFFNQSTNFFWIGIISGVLGCKIDSFLGATIERDKIDKHMTNFLATLAGGIIAICLNYFLFIIKI